MGYRQGPVVIAETVTKHGRKLTVAQFDPSHADFRKARTLLSEVEVGWGGSTTIIGSPQDRASKMTLQQVEEIVVSVLR